MARSARLLEGRDIWHVVSTNPPVRSCAEAARYRRRLGTIGIPRCDELKSLLGIYRGQDGRRRVVLLHCRGHQLLDFEKVSALVHAQVKLVVPQQLSSEFGLERGTVTPFVSLAGTPVRQLVDDSVLAEFYPPYTMMTNLGDLTNAVEFRAADLFTALDDVAVVDIVRDVDKRVPRQMLGVVIGGAPEGGSLLLAKINSTIRRDVRVQFRGTSGLPPVIVRSVPALGLSTTDPELDTKVRSAVVDAVDSVCRSGATTVTVVSSSAARFSTEIEKVCSAYGAQFISALVEVGRVVRESGVQQAELLGLDGPAGSDGPQVSDRTRPDSPDWPFSGLDVRLPTAWQLAALAHLTHSVRTELVTGATVTHLRDLVRSCRTGTAIITVPELSILLASGKARRHSGVALVDALDAVASRIAELYLEERLAVGAS